MKDWFKQLLSEDGGVSCTRFMSIVCVLTACGIAIKAICVTGSDLSATAVLCSTFLGFGTGSKVIQKFAEKKTDIEIDGK